MTKLELISSLCDITERQSKIIKQQQEIIEREKIENTAAEAARKAVEQSEADLDRLEYHLRRVCDIDDAERPENTQRVGEV